MCGCPAAFATNLKTLQEGFDRLEQFIKQRLDLALKLGFRYAPALIRQARKGKRQLAGVSSPSARRILP